MPFSNALRLCLLLIVGTLFAASAQAGLIHRGNGMVYDQVNNVTWLLDANFITDSTQRPSSDGKLTWDDAKAWVDNLVYQGLDGWRLPQLRSNTCSGFGVIYGQDCGYNVLTGNSELAYLFHVLLGNNSFYQPVIDPIRNQPVQNSIYGLENVAFTDAVTGERHQFKNVQNSEYFIDGPFDGTNRWYFDLANGYQNRAHQTNRRYVWAVRDGDVSSSEPSTPIAVSAPGSMAVLCVAGALLLMRRRKGK